MSGTATCCTARACTCEEKRREKRREKEKRQFKTIAKPEKITLRIEYLILSID
jgi:hypothetical protein